LEELVYWLFREEEGLLLLEEEEEGIRWGMVFGLMEEVRRGGGAAKGSSSVYGSWMMNEHTTRETRKGDEREQNEPMFMVWSLVRLGLRRRFSVSLLSSW
jgi:hypothetical protein